MVLSKKIQELRKQKGLTQEELANIICVSRTAISKWELGRGYPSIDSLKAIAAYFGVTVDELLTGDELLTVAQEDRKCSQKHVCDLVYGLLDLGALLLFVCPLFGQRIGNTVQNVSLLSLSGIMDYMKGLYIAAVTVMALIGVLTLAMQNVACKFWVTYKRTLSLVVNTMVVLLFILSPQPYAGIYLFSCLLIKAIVGIKTR